MSGCAVVVAKPEGGSGGDWHGAGEVSREMACEVGITTGVGHVHG